MMENKSHVWNHQPVMNESNLTNVFWIFAHRLQYRNPEFIQSDMDPKCNPSPLPISKASPKRNSPWWKHGLRLLSQMVINPFSSFSASNCIVSTFQSARFLENWGILTMPWLPLRVIHGIWGPPYPMAPHRTCEVTTSPSPAAAAVPASSVETASTPTPPSSEGSRKAQRPTTATPRTGWRDGWGWEDLHGEFRTPEPWKLLFKFFEQNRNDFRQFIVIYIGFYCYNRSILSVWYLKGNLSG